MKILGFVEIWFAVALVLMIFLCGAAKIGKEFEDDDK